MKLLKDYKNFLLEELHVGNVEISNMEEYLDGMSKGLGDKLFFLNKVDLDVLIDFGSADGTLLNYISTVKPEMKLIGYDIDEKMINISRNKYKQIQFESSWNKVQDFLTTNKDLKVGILLSSVIHEVYSYSKSNTISHFWKEQVFNPDIDYVIIRDMIPSSSYNKMNLIDIKKIREKSNPKQLAEFEEEWGNIGTDFRTLLHWLLKYRYLVNWGRELYENYLPITIEHLKNKWIPSSWNIIYEKHYTYEFIKQTVKKDFDIDLNEPTHLKMIIENKNH